MAVGGLTPMAIRCKGVEAALEGSTADAIKGASSNVVSDVGDDILEDVHASAEFRLGGHPRICCEGSAVRVQQSLWLIVGSPLRELM